MLSGAYIGNSDFITDLLWSGTKSVGSWLLVNWYWIVGIIVGFVLFIKLYDILWNYILDRLQNKHE